MNLNGKQIALIIGAIVSVLMVGGPQLTDLFGSVIAKNVVSGAGLINLMINAIMVALTGNISQDQQVRQVLAMPGIEPLQVNRKATPELAALAVDPTVSKIAPKASDQDEVTQIAASKPN